MTAASSSSVTALPMVSPVARASARIWSAGQVPACAEDAIAIEPISDAAEKARMVSLEVIGSVPVWFASGEPKLCVAGNLGAPRRRLNSL